MLLISKSIVNLITKVRFFCCPNHLIYDLTILEKYQIWNLRDHISRRNINIFINITYGEINFSAEILCDFLKNWRQLLTGRAPSGVKHNYYRLRIPINFLAEVS